MARSPEKLWGYWGNLGPPRGSLDEAMVKLPSGFRLWLLSIYADIIMNI
jgi:hypothetical protein